MIHIATKMLPITEFWKKCAVAIRVRWSQQLLQFCLSFCF